MGRGKSSVWKSCPSYLEVKYCRGEKVGFFFYLQKDIEGREGSPAQPIHPGPGVAQGPSLQPPCPHPISTPLWLPLSVCALSAVWTGLSLNSDNLILLEESVLFPVPSLLSTQQGTTCNLQVRVDSSVGPSFLEWKLALGRSWSLFILGLLTPLALPRL